MNIWANSYVTFWSYKQNQKCKTRTQQAKKNKRHSSKPEIEQEGREYIHRGIANRAFTREWKLADYVEVIDATMEDGLLFVSLERKVPEEKQPKTIEIK